MAPTAVDTMSSWCSVGFIKVGLVCNFEVQIHGMKGKNLGFFLPRSIETIQSWLIDTKQLIDLQRLNDIMK